MERIVQAILEPSESGKETDLQVPPFSRNNQLSHKTEHPH